MEEPHPGRLQVDGFLEEGLRDWLVRAADPDNERSVATVLCDVADGVCRLGWVQSHRRGGYGRELLATVLRIARRRGARVAVAYVESDNLDSRSMLTKLGFSEGARGARGSTWTLDLTRPRRRNR